MTSNVRFWPIATDRILVAERRFRGITDMAGAEAWPDPDANDPKRTSDDFLIE